MLISWVSTERESPVRIRQGKEPFYCISQVLNHRLWNLNRRRFINGCWIAKLVLQWAKLGCQDSCSNTPGKDRQNLCPSCPRRATLYAHSRHHLSFTRSSQASWKGVCRAPCGHFWVSHRSIRNTKMELEWCWAYSITAIATHTCSLLISPKDKSVPLFWGEGCVCCCPSLPFEGVEWKQAVSEPYNLPTNPQGPPWPSG